MMSLTAAPLLCLLFLGFGHCLTCNEILEAPEDKKWSVAELRTAPPKEIVECVAHLGKEALPLGEAQFIWQSVVKFYEGVVNVPDDKLALLHWVTPALEPDHYLNISLSSVDVVQNFGFDYNLSPLQLAAIAERVRDDWGGKEPEDFTYYDLVALRQILCAFNRSEVERIHPAAYREAASALAELSGCSGEVLRGLATLAVHEDAFGAPAAWSAAVVEAIGVVATGLPPHLAAQINKPATSSK